MKRLNVKLALWLVGITLVLVVGVHLLHGYQLDRNADFLRLQAVSAVEEGNSEDAINYYDQFLKYRDDPQGYSALAELVVESADRPDATVKEKVRAYNILDEAIRRHPDLTKVRRHLIDYTIMMRRFTDALEHIQILNDSGETDPKLEVQRARCHLGLGEEQRALETLYKVVSFDPDTGAFSEEPGPGAHEVDAFALLAQILRRRPDGEKRAQEVMDQLVAYNPESPQAHLARASYKRASAQIGDSKEDLDKALELAPDDPDVVLASAAFAISQKNLARAQELLDKTAASHPDRQEVYLLLAQLAMTRNQPAEGIAILERGLENASDSQAILPMLLELQLQGGDLAAAKKTCDIMDEREFAPEFVRFGRACIQMAEGNYWEASRGFELARPSLARSSLAGAYLPRLEMFLGSCYESLGLYDRQLEVARRVLQSYPTQLAARLSEAFALQRLGRYEEARPTLELLELALEKNPNVRLAVFRLLVSDQLSRPKEERDWTKVNELATLVYEDPTRSDAKNLVLKAEILMAQDQLEEAQKTLLAARQKDPKDAAVWTALVKLLFRLNKSENIGQLLDMAEKQVEGDVLALRMERIRLLSLEGGEQAIAGFQKIEQDSEKLTEPERIALMTQLGGAYLRQRDYDGAKRCWTYVAAHDAKNAQIRQLLFELMADTSDDAGMESVLQEIQASPNWGPQSSLYKYCKAMLLIHPLAVRNDLNPRTYTDAQRKTLADARRLINEAISVRGEWGALWRVRAEIDQFEGNIDAAIASYQRALACSHTGQTIVARRLVRLLSARKRFAEANKILAYVGELSATDPLSKLAQQVAVEQGDFEGALEDAEKDANEDPQNPANHIWLAHILEQAGQLDRAEEEYRKAVEVGPNLQQAWLLLVRHLVAKKKTVEAAEVIRQVAPQFEQEPLALAQMYELVGDRSQAETLYKAALAAHPDDLASLHRMVDFYVKGARTEQGAQFLVEVRKAEPYLERIAHVAKGSKDAATARELRWAHRVQAEIAAAGGTYDDAMAAAKLVEQNAEGGKLSVVDIQAIVDLLSKRPEQASRAKALRLLEELQKIRPLEPREQLLMGQLYDRAGQWSRAKDLMTVSLTHLANDPQALIAVSRAFLNHEEYEEAGRWLDKLDEVLKTSPPEIVPTYQPSAIELRARLLVKLERPDEAVAVLKRLVPNPLPPDKLSMLGDVSMLMEQLGQFDAAKALLDQYVEQDPGGVIAMAAFLGRRGELDEAFALLEKSHTSESVVNILAVAIEALRDHPDQATPARFAKLEEWGKAGLQNESENARIKLLLAEAYDLQARYPEVVRLYREVLAAKETTPDQAAVVKNNLAFVLAVTQQNLPEALKLVSESIHVLGPNSDLLDTRGLVYLNQGDLTKAIADLRMSATDSPSISKYFHLAQAEQRANNLEAARDAMARAEEFGKDISRLTPVEQKSYRQLTDELK